MLIWGLSALSHDASLAAVADGRVVFAGHAERYSRIKNDPFLHPKLITEALTYGVPDAIAWYERPYLKKIRHLSAGQWKHAFSRSDLPRKYLQSLNLPFALPDVTYSGHHEAHAMTGIATSGFSDAAVIVADAIGEFDTFTVSVYRKGHLRRLFGRSYPHSLGLLYSAFTKRCGFRPNEDEYITMGMASYGSPVYVEDIKKEFIELQDPGFRLRANVHSGIGDWLPGARREDLASSIQAITEEVMLNTTAWALAETGSQNLIVMGGVALNCVCNSALARSAGFENVWIFPNPGDAGSSIGAAATLLGEPLNWPGPYLGTDIDRVLEPSAVVNELKRNGVLAVANGRAEFGPRALGNRSIFADPRSPDMKDRVNLIKGREKFRPFAPVIRHDLAEKFFEMPIESTPYMQFTARCRHPEAFPAVVHVDETSRVQTVTREQHAALYAILEDWEATTGCPMLLNTSLNSRGEPLVNTWKDAVAFSERENIRVF